MARYNQGANWRDNAILYRMNAQSNALEYAFKRNAVPYKIVGGVKFFDRAEVKDMLAYLCVICNPADDLRLRRIINVPSRKIGGASIEKAQAIAAVEGRPLFDIIRVARKYPELKSAAGRMEDFGQLIMELRSLCDELELVEFYGRVCQMSGYVQMLQEKNDMESRGRLENVQELASSISAFLESDPDDPSLAGFLNDVALYTDLDGQSDSDNCVTLMTMHSAKGLEFDHVYVTGMDEGVFPGNRAHGRAGGNGGGAQALLCGHDPGPQDPDHDQCAPADAFWPDGAEDALPIPGGDPGGEYALARKAGAEKGAPVGR